MTIFLTIVHVLVSLFLIAVVLLQSGKGAEMGASFGSGGSQSVFGAGGGSSVISKATAVVAVVFMLTSLSLAYFAGQPSTSSVMSGVKAPVVDVKQPTQPSAVPATQGTATPAPVVPEKTKK